MSKELSQKNIEWTQRNWKLFWLWAEKSGFEYDEDNGYFTCTFSEPISKDSLYGLWKILIDEAKAPTAKELE